MSDLETDLPLVKSHVARFGAMALTLGLVNLTDLADPLENGVHYPLFLLCLQHTHKIKDKQWLVDVFNQSKLDLQSMLPGELLDLEVIDKWFCFIITAVKHVHGTIC